MGYRRGLSQYSCGTCLAGSAGIRSDGVGQRRHVVDERSVCPALGRVGKSHVDDRTIIRSLNEGGTSVNENESAWVA